MTTTQTTDRTPLTAEDLARLRELAQAATPGEWAVKRGCVLVAGPFRQYTNGQAQSQIASFSITFHEQDADDEPDRQQANTAFCAAFNPATALALLDRLEAAERALTNSPDCRMCGGSKVAGWGQHGRIDCPVCASHAGHLLLVSGKEPGVMIASNLPDGLYKLRAELETRPQEEVFAELRAIATQGDNNGK